MGLGVNNLMAGDRVQAWLAGGGGGAAGVVVGVGAEIAGIVGARAGAGTQ